MDWKTMLAYVSGSVDDQLLLRIEYLVAENHILRDQIRSCFKILTPIVSARDGSY